MFRLPSAPEDPGNILVTVYEHPGTNYLRELVSFGPAFYGYSFRGETPGEQVPLQTFLDFAIGACRCLELMHHGNKSVHGEIRADAFHFSVETRKVRLVNSGNGPRAFENILSSEGWSVLSKELGVKNKLQYIAPEQTGRLPAEPDSRTDIYSLGILFWAMLTGKPAFHGSTPIDIVQKVLSSRLLPISSKRMDVPDALSRIVAKMTQKQMDDRYTSISGVRHDLSQVAKFLGEGDQEKLGSFQIGKKDVSSFFVLPSKMIGREGEITQIIKVIEQAHSNQRSATAKINAHNLYSISSNSSISDHVDVDVADGLSNSSSTGLIPGDNNFEIGEDLGTHAGASSLLSAGSRSNSTSRPRGDSDEIPVGLPYPNSRSVNMELPTFAKPTSSAGPLPSSISTKTSILSIQSARNTLEPRQKSSEPFDERDKILSHGLNRHNDPALLFSRRGKNHRLGTRGRCEVISLLGPQGVGKSHLIHSIQPTIRRHGYFALARFDRARPNPFEPLIKAMASLLRQIFSEKDVNTSYHDTIRNNLRPVWPVLHTALDLPENLLHPAATGSTHIDSAHRATKAHVHQSTGELSTLDSMSTYSGWSSGHGPNATSEFLTRSCSTKSVKFINMFVNVLRYMSLGKTICLCLDDVHVADEESISLIITVIKSRIPVILILSSRQEEGVPTNMQRILDMDSRNKIELSPLSESEVFEYVASTLSQDVEAVVPLAAAVYEKSAGNPFLMREILQTCYRKGCLWYDWKSSGWQYSLDTVFDVLTDAGGGPNSAFVTKRLQELPPAARSILAWASLLGHSFSFSLIQGLLSGEFLYSSCGDQDMDVTCPKRNKLFNLSSSDIIEGLQTLLSSYILTVGETDDEYRFTHNRYATAANAMRECHNTSKMHFCIAQAILKDWKDDSPHLLYALARHISLSANIVKERVSNRARFRDLLYRAAQSATDSGARPTAVSYYRVCIDLLQDDRWAGTSSDCFYEETLQLYVSAAELFYLQGETSEAFSLLEETFLHARTPADKTRSWILQSRILSASGDYDAAIKALTASLREFGVVLNPTTWDQCDLEFKKLEYRIRLPEHDDLIRRPLSEDKNIIAMGSVIAEALNAAFWSDSLLFYQLTIELIKAHMDRGTCIQIGIGYCHLAMISITRFKDVELGLLLGEVAQSYFDWLDDVWTRGRGWTMFALFVGHFQMPLQNHLPILETALDYSLQSGDQLLGLMTIGAIASYRFWLGQDMAEIEAFCNDGPEQFDDWERDTRGHAVVTMTKQAARALQGKTLVESALTVMDDDNHKAADYLAFISSRSTTSERAVDLYTGMQMPVLYLFGHHEKAVELGKRLVSTTLQNLWSVRVAAGALFYYGLSLMALARKDPSSEEKSPFVSDAKYCKQQIDTWGSVHDVNYAMWSLLLQAEISFVLGDYHNAGLSYEQAIDNCQVNGFALEEALALELQAEFLLAKGVKRAGVVLIKEAIAAYNRLNAVGKGKQLAAKHEWQLRTVTTARTMDVAVQTSESLVGVTSSSEQQLETTHKDRINAWVEPAAAVGNKSTDVPGLGLDILDLSSILEFSQVISSELQVDSLLSKMTSIILESVGGQAEFVAIVINSEDQGWSIAAIGDHEKGVQTYPEGIPFADVDDQVAQHITHYLIRVRETVFVPNVLEDERFSNVSDAYLARNPNGRSIIAIPIIQADQMMGVIHLEGLPNCFTQRNLIVLNLLSTQVAISLGNALLYRKVRKVSAANASMVESQKRALAHARDAEVKAKKAEVEAKRSLKQKEEAMNAKSIFLANVSHELRTPLNGVIGMSELLKGTSLSNEQTGYADSIRVCADTLLTVINDILDFSKLEAGKMQMFAVPLNIKETITEVVRALAYTNQEHGLQTIEDLALDDSLVLGDPVRLHQIFMNLLSNAYKFTPRGSVTVKARIVSESSTSIKITCSVADTGIGISDEQLKRLFQPFSQADSSTARSYGGSGLGLSICKAMIENVLGGKIWLESTPGVGTTVSFTLTFQKAPKDAEVATRDMNLKARDPDPTANWSQGSATTPDNEAVSATATSKCSFCDLTMIPRCDIRVCIAEDNAINRKIALSYVKKLGLQAEAYDDGKQAYEALQAAAKANRPFHLVLMDVQMPVLDGYEATKAIRRDQDRLVREVLIIAMTASAIRGDREKCLEAGMNNYLAKPVKVKVLKGMLDEYLVEEGREPAANATTAAAGTKKKENQVAEVNGIANNKEMKQGDESAIRDLGAAGRLNGDVDTTMKSPMPAPTALSTQPLN
jgi:signal transduction histidine kinase/predicted ATPase/CheY-like chemotaxis protein/serine/threonine protein kinase